MIQNSDQVGNCLSLIRKYSDDMLTFVLEAEGSEITHLDSDVEFKTTGSAYTALEGLAKGLDSDRTVIVTYGEDTARVSSVTEEAEVNDHIVYVWPKATDGLKPLNSKIIESGTEISQPELDQLPRVIFLDEDGSVLTVEEVTSFVINDPRSDFITEPNHSLESLDDETAREECVDDLIGAFFDSCLGGDCEDASIFITKVRLPNGKEVQSSVSRSRAAEKSEPVMAYHELFAA